MFLKRWGWGWGGVYARCVFKVVQRGARTKERRGLLCASWRYLPVAALAVDIKKSVSVVQRGGTERSEGTDTKG